MNESHLSDEASYSHPADASDKMLERRRQRVESVRHVLIHAGGVSTFADLHAVVTKKAIREALADGAILRLARGVYGLRADLTSVFFDATDPGDAAARAAARAERVGAHRQWARAHDATLSHRSAAEYHGLPILTAPAKPEVIFIRGRRVERALRSAAQICSRELTPAERADGVTSAVRTVIDCAADLPFAEALAVADSALRRPDEGTLSLVGRQELLYAADETPLRVRAKVRRVIEHATGKAENPFESALRAIALEIPGLSVEPQVAIHTSGDTDEDSSQHRVDLADRRLRIVIEADSYAWHGSKSGFIRDCRRYSEVSADGWLILRFTWDAVINRPAQVRALLERAVALRMRELTCETCGQVRSGVA